MGDLRDYLSQPQPTRLHMGGAAHNRSSPERADERRKNAGRNQEAYQRVMRWLGRDKSVADLGRHLELSVRELTLLRTTINKISKESVEHHTMVDYLLEHLK